jgi:hypothetical protein
MKASTLIAIIAVALLALIGARTAYTYTVRMPERIVAGAVKGAIRGSVPDVTERILGYETPDVRVIYPDSGGKPTIKRKGDRMDRAHPPRRPKRAPRAPRARPRDRR